MADVLSSDELKDEPSDFGSLRPGTRLGRYELLVPIARGGMARVWAARQHGQRGFQKLVAIKTILPQLADETEFERMFLDEARIASGVHHPNVCEIYDLGEEERTLYLAMEWVSGDSLSRVLRGGGKFEAIEPRIVARIVADACAGVHAAHELTDEDGRQLGVVHRDMSPQNILLTADGVAKVCDFGVAKALGQLHEQTSAGQLKGKLSYMSPEQVTGAPVDRRSDVFSLGCVLYEATTGARAFRAERDHLIIQAILNGEVAPPTSFIRNYPVELERIVLRALAHQPILRYPDAERMRFALEEFLTRGQLVTHSNVAQVVRARIGEQLERRKERIRQASAAAEQAGWDPASSRDGDHRSGVQPSRTASHLPELAAAPLGSGGVPAAIEVGEADATIHGHGLPPISRTVPPVLGARAALETPQPFTPMTAGPGAGLIAGAATHHGAAGHSLPPASGNATNNPYGDRASYDVSRSLSRDVAAQHFQLAQQAQQKEAGAGQYILASLAGILFAIVIAGGFFFAWQLRASRGARPVAVAPAASPVASSAVSARAAPAPSSEIAFKVTPADATLVVDGKELAPDQRAIPRPAAGKSVNVVLRAKDHEDTSLQVDYFTTAPVEIALRRSTIDIDEPPRTRPSVEAPAAPAAAPPVVTAKPVPRPTPVREPAGLPENPY